MDSSTETINQLRALSVFERLSDAQAVTVLSHMEVKSFTADSDVFTEGDQGDALYFITAGFLEITKEKGTDKEKVLANIGPGQAIGEMAIIDNYPRSATATAKSDVEALMLTADSFNHIVNELPSIGVDILKGIAHALSMNLRYIDFLTVQEDQG